MFLIRFSQPRVMWRITKVHYVAVDLPLICNVRHKNKDKSLTWFTLASGDRLLTYTEAVAYKLRTLNVIVID